MLEESWSTSAQVWLTSALSWSNQGCLTLNQVGRTSADIGSSWVESFSTFSTELNRARHNIGQTQTGFDHFVGDRQRNWPCSVEYQCQEWASEFMARNPARMGAICTLWHDGANSGGPNAFGPFWSCGL